MKNGITRYLQLAFGIVLAIAVLCSTSFSSFLTVPDTAESCVAAAEEDGTEKSDTTLTLSVSPIPTANILSVSFDAVCIFEIIFSTEESTPSPEQDLLPVSRFIDTILGVVISPNAP